MVVAKNVPYEFKCVNLVEDSRFSLSPSPNEYKISAGFFLESSSLMADAQDASEKGSFVSKRFLPEIASPEGVYISKDSYIIPSAGIFKKMNSRWDDSLGSYLCEHTGSLAGSIVNGTSAFRTENPLTYSEIVNLKSKVPSDLSSRWNYIENIPPKTSGTIYMSLYYRSDSPFDATVNWKIDKNETVKATQVSCGPSWKKLTVQTAFNESSMIAPYIGFSYSATSKRVYVSPVFLSWGENEFPSSKLYLLEKWSDKFRSKSLDEVYYTISDPNPLAPVEKEIKYGDVPEGKKLVSDYCEWFKSWALLAPDYFTQLYNFAFNKNYSNFNDLLEDSHASATAGNFFLAKEDLESDWGLKTQEQVLTKDAIYIADVVGQDSITYKPHEYISVRVGPGEILNNKIADVFDQELDQNTVVLRSTFLREGVMS